MKGRKPLAEIASLLLVLITLTACAGGVSQEEFDALKAQQTALEKDYGALREIHNLETGIRDLRNSADINFALASAAVEQSKQADWDPSRGPGLVETATGRLDQFIEDAQELIIMTRALTAQVPAESRSVYEKSVRLWEAKIKEGLYLKELVEGISFQYSTVSEIADVYFSCVVATDELRSGWVSKLDKAIVHHQAGIRILNQAEEIAPELSFEFIEAIAELERLIKQASSLKEDLASPLDPPEGDDHGNSISKATLAELPCSIVGTIGDVGDLDYFSIQAQADTTYVMTLAGGTPGEFNVALYNSQGQQLTSYYGQPGIVYTATTSAALYAVVQNNRGGTGTYTLSISVPSDDHGNSISKATAAAVPSSTDGAIDYVGDLDYFSIQAQADTTYVIALAGGTSGEFNVALYNSQGQPLPLPYSYGQPGIAYTATTSAALYVAVQNNRGGTGTYTLSISEPSDDHGNSISKATAVAVPSTAKGVIEYGGDLDYFSIQAQADTTYVIALAGGTSGEFNVGFYNSQGQQLPSNYGQPSIAYTATTSAALYAVVQNNRGGTGSYTLSISVPSDDHGNSISKATAVAVPSTAKGVIEYGGDLDYFSIQAQADTTYVIAVAGGTSGEFNVGFYNSQGQQLPSNYGQPSIAYTATTSAALYVVVQNNRGGTGSYTLSISVPSDDHGNSISKATAAAVPSTTNGAIEYVGDLDYFSIQAKAGTTYVFAAAGGTSGEFGVSLYNSSGQQLIYFQSSITYAATTSGALYVVVQNGRGSTGSYTLGILVLDAGT